MSKFNRALLALTVTGLAAAAAPAFAQTSANTSVTGTMTVYQPITISKASDLSFGTVMRPASGNGTIYINKTTGARTADGAASLVANGPNAAPSRAAFTVSGETGLNISITVPQSFDMLRSGGGGTVQVMLDSTASGGQLTGNTNGSGTFGFGVGGQVLLSNGTPTGAYSGTFTVSVAYN
ncbi:DUF4402 domain-containing protein [Phenylobacterium sp. VNQ135]|uniref:DUF4402 domain-containing protein n=1 Tax=Phenylobacterium sp. VNQ135 TaxID=3400922 RepID=UPI003C1257FF